VPPLRRLAVAFLLSCIGSVAFAGPAAAHATLISSDPRAGIVVAEVPQRITLTFDQPVRLGLGRIAVLDPDGTRVDDGQVRHPSGNERLAATDIRGHAHTGTFLVSWRVVSADGHPIQGSFTFSAGQPSAAPSASNIGQTNAGLRVVVVAARWLSYVGLALLLGAVLMALLQALPRVPSLPGSLMRLAIAGWVLATVSTVAGLLLQGPYAGALPLSSAWDGEVLGDVASSQFGQAHLARLGLLGVVIPLLLLAPLVRVGRWATIGLGLVAVAALPTWPAAGHAGTGSGALLASLVDSAHLGAVAVWVGGLAALTFVVLRSAPTSELAATLPRWSWVAAGSVGVLVLTGFIRSLREVGELDALTGTSYGWLLLAKLAVVVVVLALGNYGRVWVSRHTGAGIVPTGMLPRRVRTALSRWLPDEPVAPREIPQTAVLSLRRSVAAESAIAAAVLAITAVLVGLSPGREALARPYDTIAKFDDVTVQLVVEPARAGRNQFHLYTTDSAGQRAPVEEVSARAGLPDKDIAPIDLPLTNPEPAHYELKQLDLPVAGEWLVEVRVRTSEFDQESFTRTIRIR
jgi:copper transport protein